MCIHGPDELVVGATYDSSAWGPMQYLGHGAYGGRITHCFLVEEDHGLDITEERREIALRFGVNPEKMVMLSYQNEFTLISPPVVPYDPEGEPEDDCL